MKVKIINPVQHDSKNLAPDEVVNLPDAAAALLIECGAAVSAGRSIVGGKPPADSEPPADAELAADADSSSEAEPPLENA